MLFLENCSKASFLQLLILSSNWQLKCIHTQHTNSSPPSLMSPSGCIYKQCSHLYPAFILPSSANQARFICNLTIRQAVYLINLLYLFQILQECDKLELCKVFLHTFLMLLHLFFLLSGQSLQNLQISRFCKRPCRWQQLLRTSVMWWRDGELGVQMGSRRSEWSSDLLRPTTVIIGSLTTFLGEYWANELSESKKTVTHGNFSILMKVSKEAKVICENVLCEVANGNSVLVWFRGYIIWCSWTAVSLLEIPFMI